MLAESHVLVVYAGYELQVPAKLYEYVGLRRPILALAEDGAVARVVRDGGFGLVASPTNVDSIAEALTDLYRRHGTLVQNSIDNARVAHFDASISRPSSRRSCPILSQSERRTSPADFGDEVFHTCGDLVLSDREIDFDLAEPIRVVMWR